MEFTDIFSAQNIMAALGIIGMVFTIYNSYLKNRKEDAEKITNTEKSDIVLSKDIQLLRAEVSLKVDNLANEIKEMNGSLDLLKQNDLHSIYEKQKDQDAQIGKHTVAIEKLTTIIDERVPRKTVDEIK